MSYQVRGALRQYSPRQMGCTVFNCSETAKEGRLKNVIDRKGFHSYN